MTPSSVDRLPTVHGRGIRVAYVVFNDTSGDTRVLKIAESAAVAGANVRIFAISNRLGKTKPGVEVLANGVEIERLSIWEISYLLPGWGLAARRLLRRPLPQYVDPSTLPPAEAREVLVALGAPPKAGLVNRGKRRAIDLWGRANATLRQASFWMRARKALVAWQPDLIHAHDANTLVPAMSAASDLKVPFLYDSHELWTQRNVRSDRPLAKRFEQVFERIGARRANAVISVSPSIVTWLHKRYRLSATPGLVRNIPPFDGEIASRSDGRLRQLAGLDGSSKVVVYCGGITTNRGIEEAIRALALLEKHVHLVLLGYGSELYRASLHRLVNEHDLASRVHFVGTVESSAVSRTLADADVSLVLTRPTCLSYEYSLPNKLFESIHAGIPVVTTALPDASDLVKHFNVGEVVSVEASPQELATALDTAILISDSRRDAVRAAAEQLTWQNESARLFALYRALLGDRS
jgi:glycosyltransferase involved in cell wall biosynthesis